MSLDMKWPCAVCGKPTPPAAPLTICASCKQTDGAQYIRRWYRDLWEKAKKEGVSIMDVKDFEPKPTNPQGESESR